VKGLTRAIAKLHGTVVPMNRHLTFTATPEALATLPVPSDLPEEQPPGHLHLMFEQTFKNIDDILHKDAGCTSELDYNRPGCCS
jgi:hypothetical protein